MKTDGGIRLRTQLKLRTRTKTRDLKTKMAGIRRPDHLSTTYGDGERSHKTLLENIIY